MAKTATFILMLVVFTAVTVVFASLKENDPVFAQALKEANGDRAAAIRLMGFTTCDENGHLVYVAINRSIRRNRQPPLRINNGVLREIQQFDSIKTLIIGVVNNIDDDGMDYIASLENLEMLNINLVPITDRGLQKLTALEKLQVLMVDSANLSDQAIEDFRASMPDCELRVIAPHRR